MALLRTLILSAYALILAGNVASAQVNVCDLSDADFANWRDDRIHDMLKPTLDSQGERFIQLSVVRKKAAAIYDILSKCAVQRPDKFGDSAPNALRFSNLKRFCAQQKLLADSDHQFAMKISDTDYLNTVREDIEIPELLRSERFLQAVSDPARYHEAFQMIEDRNKNQPIEDRWVVFLYKSQFLTTPDGTTYGRFFILVPGNPDRWIQYGIVTPDLQDRRINSMSIVSVRKRSEQPPKSDTALVDYWRVYNEADGIVQSISLPTKFEAGFGSEDCYNCHKTPLLGIHPLEEYEFTAQNKLVKKTGGTGLVPAFLNDRIAAYGPPNFRGLQMTFDYGPALGPTDRNRDETFMQRNTAKWNLSEESRARVKNAMNCTACHNSTLLGPMNFPQALRTDLDLVLRNPQSGEQPGLIGKYVQAGLMPPSHNLIPDEKAALVNCLLEEYYDSENKSGIFFEWLRGDFR
jgi:hypothetical protein